MKKCIEHYDEVANETFSIPEFNLSAFASEEEFFATQRNEIMHAIYLGLYDGIEYNYKQVPIFAIADTDAVFTLQNYEYLDRCEECLKYYLEIEEYGMCNTLKKLKDKLCQRIQELEV